MLRVRSANEQGLRIESRAGRWRPRWELLATWQPLPHHAAFENVLNGGIIGTLLDCHANWTAAMRIMRDRGLDQPPGCVTADYSPSGCGARRRSIAPPRSAPGRWGSPAIASSSTPNSFRVASSPPRAAALRCRRSRPSRLRTLVEETHVQPFLRTKDGPATAQLAARPAPSPPIPAGDTATVRRIVAKLEAMPPEQARLLASAAYTLARAANADLDISDEETAAVERELQAGGSIDEATAVLVTEMAKLRLRPSAVPRTSASPGSSRHSRATSRSST